VQGEGKLVGQSTVSPPLTMSFLSWAGSKRRLLPAIVPHVPQRFRRYLEPFAGGASLFFFLKPGEASLGDANAQLIDTFRAVRDEVDGVIAALARLPSGRKAYYSVRDTYGPRTRASRAARFIYLNKTCWNGLYRENLLGKFNTPFGSRRTPFAPDRYRLRACSQALEAADLLNADFEASAERAEKGDFVYFDPPFVTMHNNNGFREYNSRLFTWQDQVRLARCAERLSQRGVSVLVSNAWHGPLIKMYPNFDAIPLTRYSTIAAARSARRPTTEVLFKG
jgi:DNA adenine methylase